MTNVATYMTITGRMAPMENMRRQAMLAEREENTSPARKPRHIPTLVFGENRHYVVMNECAYK